MKKLPVPLAVLLAVTLTGAAAAAASPPPGAERAAKQECGRLARADGEAFAAAFGAGGMPACVRRERPEAGAVAADAGGRCRAERGRSGRSREAFRDSYRSRPGSNDAFGRCVAAGLRDHWLDELRAFLRAARECRAERGHTPESRAAFAEAYGIDPDDPLSIYLPDWVAFGRCVISKLDG
ncbi:MAG: hypothetical protein BroJett022_08060 [Actinomycetes bacterium]|nr:MAG: hypothetical protein BroJett022_08060 [Actinomycetes bacterium]